MKKTRDIAHSCGCSAARPCYSAAKLFDAGDWAGLERHLHASAYVAITHVPTDAPPVAPLMRRRGAGERSGASPDTLSVSRPASRRESSPIERKPLRVRMVEFVQRKGGPVSVEATARMLNGSAKRGARS